VSDCSSGGAKEENAEILDGLMARPHSPSVWTGGAAVRGWKRREEKNEKNDGSVVIIR
jgi:hypothetical protein